MNNKQNLNEDDANGTQPRIGGVERYKLLIGMSKDLNHQVNQHLAEGWRLYGNPFSDSDDETTRLCQAVIKEGHL